MNAAPPYTHPIELSGEIVKVGNDQNGIFFRLESGVNSYKVIIDSVILSKSSLLPELGNRVKFTAKNNRAQGYWIASSFVIL